MKLTTLVALAAIFVAVPAIAGAQHSVNVNAGWQSGSSDRDWREFRDAKKDLVSTIRYRDFKNDPSRRTAEELRESRNYAEYVRWYWAVRNSRYGREMPSSEREFYNNLQDRLGRYLGRGWDSRRDDNRWNRSDHRYDKYNEGRWGSKEALEREKERKRLEKEREKARKEREKNRKKGKGGR